jgi:SAM-dependent methyltransferase
MLQAVERDSREIREGQVTCNKCGAQLRIHKGVVHTLLASADTVRREAKGWMEMLYVPEKAHEFKDDWILALPFVGSDQTSDQDSVRVWHTMGRHFFEVVNRFDWRHKRVLEIGAGRCWVVAELARRGAEAVGLDILTHKYLGLETADVWMTANPALYFERVLGDMNRLPFQPGVFDFVVATASMHHTETLDQAVQETARVLNPQGCVLLINEPLVLTASSRPDLSQSPEILHNIVETRPTYTEWVSAFESAGLGIDQVQFADGMHVVLKKGLPHAGLRRFRIGRQAEAWFWTLWEVLKAK